MNCEKLFYFDGNALAIVKEGDDVWFYGKEVADTLGYKNPSKVIRDHVMDDEKRKTQKLNERNGASAFIEQNRWVWQINESGLYRLIFSSKLETAENFRKWVFRDVLPSIRKTGGYMTPVLRGNQFKMINEFDLHTKVVDYVRKYYPDAVLVAACGENQDSKTKRSNSWKKGYLSGTPDLLILSCHKNYHGFAIEFKNPGLSGKLSANQRTTLRKYDTAGYLTMVIESYDEAITSIVNYMNESRFKCPWCVCKFMTTDTLGVHNKWIHRDRTE